MEIKLQKIPIAEAVKNFSDNAAEGVIGWDNKLNIRPPYQREFVYKDKQRNAVINTIRKNFPLNVMYWAKNNDGTYEVLDGQQRLLSLCTYVEGKFSIDYRYFHNLEQKEKDQILNYKLMVYTCEGDPEEKLSWFKTINIAGEKLTNQELRNAMYTGSWLSDAKEYFSKPGCPAYEIAYKYVKGSPIRQDYLETALTWASSGNIEKYMAEHQHKQNAAALWLYFKRVIDWVDAVFPNYRKEMKGLPFGSLYRDYGKQELYAEDLEKEISNLMQDEDVTKKSGIYLYVLTRDEKYLNLRAFSPKQRVEAYERQKGICAKCGEHFEIDEMEADHITPWSKGGKTDPANCQMLCKKDNRSKSDK